MNGSGCRGELLNFLVFLAVLMTLGSWIDQHDPLAIWRAMIGGLAGLLGIR